MYFKLTKDLNMFFVFGSISELTMTFGLNNLLKYCN